MNLSQLSQAKRPLIARSSLLFAALSLIGILPASADDLQVYLSRPKDGLSPFSSITTETWESPSAGTLLDSAYTSALGVYTFSSASAGRVQGNDIYGAGTGNYLAFGSQSGTSGPIHLLFNAPQAYFGFTWCAGDANNALSFYNGATFIGRFSTATILDALSNSTVTSIDGHTYLSSDYYGQPQTGQNSNEPYAFVNFIDTVGTFTEVVFDNSSSGGTGFESDNHTVRRYAPSPDGSFVSVGQTTPTGQEFAGGSAAPEPRSVALLLAGLLPVLGSVKQRIQRVIKRD